MSEASVAKPPIGVSRARVETIVDEIERCLLEGDISGIKRNIDPLLVVFSDPTTTLAALEAGALEALLTLLARYKDEKVADAILSAILALGKRQVLSNDTSVSIAALIRIEGLTTIVRVVDKYKQSNKIRELVIKILGNCAADELGARLVIHSKACILLLDSIKNFPHEKNLLINSLSTLANCCLFHLGIRGELLGAHSVDPLFVQRLLSIARVYKQDVDVLEQVLCILCLLSTGKAGAKSLLAIPVAPQFVDAANCSVEAAAIASDALGAFAVRTYQRSVDETRQLAAGLIDSPLNVLKNSFQRFSNNTMASPPAPAVSVATNLERRCCAWALMLLHNLALVTTDHKTRLEISELLQKHSSEDGRELCKRILDRIRILMVEASENVQEEDDAFEASSSYHHLVEMVLPNQEGEFSSDDANLALLSNVAYLQQSDEDGSNASADFGRMIEQVSHMLQMELTQSSNSPLPLSPKMSRLLSLVITMFSHPYVREQLTSDHFDMATMNILEPIRRSEPPEFFKHISRTLELALGNRSPIVPLMPHRSLPLLATVLPLASHHVSVSSSTGTPSTAATTTSASSAVGTSSPIKGKIGSSPVATTPPSGTATVQNGSTPLQIRNVLSSFANSSESNKRRNPLSGTRESIPDSSADFSLFRWRYSPRELCRQVTLKMERLYGTVNPCLLMLDKQGRLMDEHAMRFCKFHSNLVGFFEREILDKGEAEDRASLIECIIVIGFAAAQSTVSNCDLTMACLETLEAPSIKRLAISWKKVRPDLLKVFEELRGLSRIEDMADGWNNGRPPPFLSAPSIPYLKGCLAALEMFEKDKAQLAKRDLIMNRYHLINAWLPRMSRKGDWHAVHHMFAPVPVAQMTLSDLSKFPPTSLDKNNTNGEDMEYLNNNNNNNNEAVEDFNHSEEDSFQFSLALEPNWALEQAEMEDKIQLRARVGRYVEERVMESYKRNMLSAFDTADAEEFGIECRNVTKEILRRDDIVHVNMKKRMEDQVRAAVEQGLLRSHLSRLQESAMIKARSLETSLISKCDSLQAISFTSMCEVLGVPEAFRLHWWGPVALMRAWSASFGDLLPHASLEFVLQIKDAIFTEARSGGLKEMSADELLPVLALIIVRASPKTLCAASSLLQMFYGDDLASGEAAYYLVSIESAVQLIAHLKI